ncbi:MAG: hypothetical protein U5L00_15180 [Desulfovermiculus sp.]|nr:hypothetical protein [Desulfovermiculus sp.]
MFGIYKHIVWLIIILTVAGTFAAAGILLLKKVRSRMKRQRTLKHLNQDRQDSLHILNQRLEQGEINSVEYKKMKASLFKKVQY